MCECVGVYVSDYVCRVQSQVTRGRRNPVNDRNPTR